MRILRRTVLLLAALVLLGACEVRSYLDIDLTDPTAGTVAVQIGFDDELRQAVDQLAGGADLLQVLEDDAPGDGWTVETFTDGAIEGVILSKPFSSIAELQRILAEGRASGPQEAAIGEITFTDDGNTIRFEAGAPAIGEGRLEGLDPSEFGGLLEYDARIRVIFPGEVVKHNGQLEGNTVTWTFADPAAMAGARLFAEARKSAGFPWVAVAGVLMGLAVVGLVVWRIRQPEAVDSVSDASAPEGQGVASLPAP
jgi:hypothetical protein